uniref:Uncharacterized protein n=1 Tax=Zea mays TaxID=4577 RepID=A0A804LM81_MAIZE
MPPSSKPSEMASKGKGTPAAGEVDITYLVVTSVGIRPWYARRRPNWIIGFMWPCAGRGTSRTWTPPCSRPELEPVIVVAALELSIIVRGCGAR